MANATSTQLQELYVAYFGRAADPTGLDYWTEKGVTQAAFAASMYAQAEFKDEYGDKSVEAQVNQIYKNLFDRAADETGLLYWTQQINLGNVVLAEVATDLIWAAQNNSGSTDDKTALSNRTAAAVAYTAKVKETTAAILAYQPTSSDPWNAGENITEAKTYLLGIDKDTEYTDAGIATSVTTITTNGTPGLNTTYTLTSGTDSGSDFVGTAYQDTFNATTVNEGGVANVVTMNVLDSIDGAGGIDTLNATINASVTPTSLANIEIINLTALADATAGTDAAADVFGLGNSTAVTDLNFNATADDDGVTVNGLNAILTGGVEIKNTAVSHTVTVANAVLAGSADSLTIDLDAVTAGTMTFQPVSGTNGYETFTINSNGSAANTIAAFADGTSTSGTTINIGGAQNLTITGALAAQFTTVSAANATGNINLTATNAAVMNITGGAGNDTFDLSGVFIDQSDTTNGDTVNGGDGVDVLRLTWAEANAVTNTAQWANVTNVETVRLDTTAASNLDLANLTGVTTIEFDGAITTGRSHVVASGQELQYDVADNNSDTQTFTIEGVATTDTLSIDINGVDVGNGQQTYTGVETLNIATSGTSLMDGAHVMTATAATEAMNISGTGTLTMGNITTDSITSTMTAGTLTLGTMQQATAITGAAEILTVVGSTAADIISGGAGADIIQNTASGAAATAADVLTGGAGFDRFALVGDVATGAMSTILGQASYITDFTVGTATTNTDFLALSINEASYTAPATALADASAATAAGTTIVQTVAASAGAAAETAGVDLVKLTTAVAATGTLQQAFNTAIGTSTITGVAQSHEHFFTLYDTNTTRMIVGIVDAGASNTVVATADVVSLIGSVAMTQADYANFDTDNFVTIA